MDIGNRIKKYRKEVGLTQRELADKVHKSPQVISNWERGYTPNITNDDIVNLASALSVGVTDLVEPSFTVTHADRLPDKVVPITQLIMKMFHDEPEILEQLTGVKEIYGMEKLLDADINNMPEEQFQTIKFALKAGLKAMNKK